ncbi:MAG TPA: hypothetical protein VNQ81_04070 [Povalibacter sp.]|nr:hypothetical protein [Povalibacter sp.]
MPAARCTRPVTVVVAAMAIGCGVPAGWSTAEPIDAIWQVRQVDFAYASRNVYYSCGALQSKIKAIMKAVGARQGVTVSIDCREGQFVNSAVARLTVALPAEATEEAVRAATTFDTRAQLVARLQRIQLPTANDIERFPAAWQTISLTDGRKLRLEAGDCDLLLGIYQQVFPRLSIQPSGKGLRCFGPSTRVRPQLQITALLPMRLPVAYSRQDDSHFVR